MNPSAHRMPVGFSPVLPVNNSDTTTTIIVSACPLTLSDPLAHWATDRVSTQPRWASDIQSILYTV